MTHLSKEKSRKHRYLNVNSCGVSNICPHKSYKYETTFSPRTQPKTWGSRLHPLEGKAERDESMYRKAEVADWLTVSIATDNRLIKTKKLTVAKIGSCIRVTDDSLQQVFTDCEVR